ncbi:MAG: hypothetical protein ABIQ39_10365 [Ilumatobacteraceae bacterium]
MFGRSKMSHHGTANVVMSQLIQNGRVKDEYGYRVHKYDLIVDVTPDEGSPFRAETSGWFEGLHAPRKGDVVKVMCDAADKSVELDIADDVRYNLKLVNRARKTRTTDERQRLLEGEPGTD